MSVERIERLAEAIVGAMPRLGRSQQRLAVATYRNLARGRPVGDAQLARQVGLDEDRVRGQLDSWPGVYRDGDGRIVGFWGLALPEMPHRLSVGGVSIYAWCAYDPLFIAPLLGRRLQVRSKDPVSGDLVTLSVGPEGVEGLSPREAVASFLEPRAPWGHDVIGTFCHFVHFFARRESGERWRERHPDSLLLWVEDGFEVGRRANARVFDRVVTPAETTIGTQT